MKKSTRPDHHALAEALRQRVLEGPGETDSTVRRAVAERAAGGAAAEAAYDDLARQIGESADHVTDAQVAGVVAATGSGKAAFEIIAAAALGAGLLRWRQGIKVLQEAIDAPE
jgi:aspartate aminotransferase-like enzyme